MRIHCPFSISLVSQVCKYDVIPDSRFPIPNSWFLIPDSLVLPSKASKPRPHDTSHSIRTNLVTFFATPKVFYNKSKLSSQSTLYYISVTSVNSFNFIVSIICWWGFLFVFLDLNYLWIGRVKKKGYDSVGGRGVAWRGVAGSGGAGLMVRKRWLTVFTRGHHNNHHHYCFRLWPSINNRFSNYSELIDNFAN